VTSVSPDSACSRRKPFAGLIGPRPALLVWCSPEGTDLALSVGHWSRLRTKWRLDGRYPIFAAMESCRSAEAKMDAEYDESKRLAKPELSDQGTQLTEHSNIPSAACWVAP